jgi:hypothetical protein
VHVQLYSIEISWLARVRVCGRDRELEDKVRTDLPGGEIGDGGRKVRKRRERRAFLAAGDDSESDADSEQE